VVTVSAPLGPPTLTASPIISGDGNIAVSGTGVAGATVSLFDGQTQFATGIPVDSSGAWSLAPRYFLVGSHPLSARQTSGGQTSGPSPIVTVYHPPPPPNISGPSSVVSATSPATVTLTGFGFYGAGQTPPTGSTVTIFEGTAPIGTAVVGSNGQWSTAVTLAFGPHPLTASQTLAGLTSTLSSRLVVTVKDNTPPVLTLPPNMVKEASGPTGALVTFTASANDATSGPAPVTCTPASGSLFPLGSTTVNCSATDAFGNIATGTFTVTVRDTTPPVIGTLMASPGVLWPANHKMVSIGLGVTASDTVTPAPVCRVVSVTSNEPLNGIGDGNTATDYTFSGVGLDLSLRAERTGTLTDRIYTVGVVCKDAAGNDSTAKAVAVVVPHDQGKK
jgi:hypothetical protein